MNKYVIKRHYTSIGKVLSDARYRSDLTQREVANKLRYSSPQFISNFERGIAMPPIKKMRVLLKMYHLDPSVVIDAVMKDKRKLMINGLSK